MPRGVPQIEVSFDVDANGILNVSAMEKSTGKSQKITITNDKGRLSKDEIERLVRVAEDAAAEDAARMERVEARNQLEGFLYNARNSANDEAVKSKLSAEDAETIKGAVDSGLQWLDAEGDSADTETLKGKMKEVQDKIQPIFMRMYQEGGAGADSAAEPPKGPVVDEVD